MIYVNCPLSLRNVEDLLFERGLDICHATVRLWWTRFGPERVRRMETLQKTISIRNAISSASITTESAAQPPWRTVMGQSQAAPALAALIRRRVAA